jgi:hypothetical protein
MPDPTDDQDQPDGLKPTRPTYRARLSALLWPPGAPESQTAIHHPSGLNAAISATDARQHSEPVPDQAEVVAPAELAPTPQTGDREATPSPQAADSKETDTYQNMADQHRAKEPPEQAYDARADNIRMVEARTAEDKARAPAQPFQAAAQHTQDVSTQPSVTAPEFARAPQSALSDRSLREIVSDQVREMEPRAAIEVTARTAAPAPPEPPLPPQDRIFDTQPRELSGREGQAPSSARFDALRAAPTGNDAAAMETWASEQIPLVARAHFDHWRQADQHAVEAVDHMTTDVPGHSRDVETRLLNVAVEVRHAFDQARTGLDLIEHPSPATLKAFMEHAHHQDTPDLLKTSSPQEVPAIVIADSAALSADLRDTIDALDGAISALAHEEAALGQVAPSQGAPSLHPANGNAGQPTPALAVDDRPTFQHLTDARLDDINTILEEARSNDNRAGTPVAVVLAAAAAQTFHRIAGLDGMDADTPEHEQAAEATREDISSLIATVADAREVHVTAAEFAGVEAQDEAALAAMLALSSNAAEGATADDGRTSEHLAEMEALTGEMTDARYDRLQSQAHLAAMEELSDYKAEATEKNASRERNSGRDPGGAER